MKFVNHGLVALLAGLVILSILPIVATVPSVAARTCEPLPHRPILIRSDADFKTSNGVISGSGTVSDPYLIADLKLDDVSLGYGLKVDNSGGGITKFFNVECVQSTFESSPTSGAKLVWLVNVHTATTITNLSGNADEASGTVGVEIDSSSNITLAGLSLNKIGYDGVLISSSDHIRVLQSKLKAMHNGLTVRNSHDIIVGSPCNLASDNRCNDFTYDDGRGIYILNSHDVQIQYTITTADDTGGIILDGSQTYHVQLNHGIASGNGPICPTGTPTGEKVDTIAGLAIVNGAHDITVSGYTLQGNSHYDIMNGGDGFYVNPCTGQIESLGGATASGGADLNVSGNCYRSQYGFNPVPTFSCGN